MNHFDLKYMQRAIALGEQGRLTAPPNPWVGCVIVKNGAVIGEGFHVKPGEPHAEIHALKQAGLSASGSTVYVTLEPCSHEGRTPPCCRALIEAGVAAVAVAIEDPDARVSGQGISALQKAGIQVHVGLGALEASESLKPYLHHRLTARPYCILKAAVSIDGRIAAQDLSSQWISTPESRIDAHLLRSHSQAILVGAGTALADNPTLTVRDVPVPPQQPLRVLLDARGRVEAKGALFDTTLAPTLVFTTDACPEERIKEWQKAGCAVEIIPGATEEAVIPLKQVLESLGKRSILQLLIEGGSQIHSSFLKQQLFDQIVLYVGPRILGSKGIPLFANESPSTIAQAPILKLIQSKQFGDTMRLDYIC